MNRVRRSGLLPAFRRAVREVYGLDPELERLCWRARAGDGEPGFPAALCNLVWQWRDAFLLAERETPNLLPLLRAAAEGGLPVEPANPVPGIKRELRRAGVSERFWRVIARSSGRLFLPALEIRGRGKAWDTLVNYARALDQAGVGFEPPAAAMRALVRFRVNPGAGDGLREDWSRADPRLLGMALRQARRRAQSTEEELVRFLRIPEVSKSANYHNVIENLKRMHDLPCIHICRQPLYPLEASGTSGMKAAMNGVHNLSVLDGWWDEGYDGRNGWAIKPVSELLPEAQRNREESHTLYELLQDHVIPAYYNRKMGYSEEWVKMSKSSIATLLPRFNTARMVGEYVSKFYLPAGALGRRVGERGFAGAQALAQWEERILAACRAHPLCTAARHTRRCGRAGLP